MDEAIVAEGLGKRFRIYHADRPSTLQEVFQRGLRRLRPADYFWALRDVSFRIPSGHMVGVIGPNGAGKSTLLQLIGGIGRPDRGQVRVHGRIGGLLDLGAGFHPDLTGRENVFISGIISGLTRREVTAQFDSIVAFAELEEFIDNPLRTYSTGMQMRLAFAIASHVDSEILLIDEILAVGDMLFQKKCIDRIRRFKTDGCTTLLVSHSLSLIEELCDDALWFESGQLIAHGPAAEVATRYVVETTARAEVEPPGASPAEPAGEPGSEGPAEGSLE